MKIVELKKRNSNHIVTLSIKMFSREEIHVKIKTKNKIVLQVKVQKY